MKCIIVDDTKAARAAIKQLITQVDFLELLNEFDNGVDAFNFLKKEDVDFTLLAPLIKETAERIQNASPGDVQTGPAVRNDIFTIEKHLRILADHPNLKNIYIKLSDSIMKG